ncbi:hypothetical protein AALA98_09135 [Lachnospiraceae bacterium 45-W7]
MYFLISNTDYSNNGKKHYPILGDKPEKRGVASVADGRPYGTGAKRSCFCAAFLERGCQETDAEISTNMNRTAGACPSAFNKTPETGRSASENRRFPSESNHL